MKQTYHIKGMTCNGCRTQVEKLLSEVAGVHTATVSLEQEEATLLTEKLLDIAILRNSLPEKYSITEIRSNDDTAFAKSGNEQKAGKWRQLKPLFLILGYIAIASILLHYKALDTKAMMTDFMGLFFIVFSFFKLLDLKGFVNSFVMYDPLAGSIRVYAWVYPFIEVALGLMFLLRWKIQIALVVTIIVLGITTIGVTRTLLKKDVIQCACLGTALNLPMTEATFIENAIMIVMAFIMLLVF